MQKPVEGVYLAAENVGGGVAIGWKTAHWHVETLFSRNRYQTNVPDYLYFI